MGFVSGCTPFVWRRRAPFSVSRTLKGTSFLAARLLVLPRPHPNVDFGTHNSEEFDRETPNHAIVYMPEFNSHGDLGGTMRLGARVTSLYPLPSGKPSLAQDIYGGPGVLRISERHRHRYEVNPKLVAQFEEAGLHFTGRDYKPPSSSSAHSSPQRGASTGNSATIQQSRMEIAELDRETHPFFWCCQYHPELQSFPHSPSPPFWGLVTAAAGEMKESLPFPLDLERGVAFSEMTPTEFTPSRSPFPTPASVKETMKTLNLNGSKSPEQKSAILSLGTKRKGREELDE